jgi:hypothetical protein
MKELLISWKPSAAATPRFAGGGSSSLPISSADGKAAAIPSGISAVRRIYRWGSYIGILCKNEWMVEQRILIQETPIIEECISVSRAAPPATVDDAWEETYIDHGDYQSVEGSLLQIRITLTNYKKQIMTAIALGCPIDSSTLRMCETMVQPVELIPQMMEETPVSRLVPLVPRSVPQQSPLAPRGLFQEGRRQEGRRQEGRRQEGRRQEGRNQDCLAREIASVRSRLNGGVPHGQLAAAPVHRTLSVSPSGWLGTEE